MTKRNISKKKKADTKKIILEAARKVFSRHPFSTATTRMIASEAGIDHPLIHYYFQSKEKLFEAVAEELFISFMKAFSSWLEGLEEVKPKEQFPLFIDRLLEYCLENPESLELVFMNMTHVDTGNEAPGLHYIRRHMDQVQKTLQTTIPVQLPQEEVRTFIHCFDNMVISFIGARSSHARVLGLKPDSPEYRKWLKKSFMELFRPWLIKIVLANQE